jgi:hypothetical protein
MAGFMLTLVHGIEILWKKDPEDLLENGPLCIIAQVLLDLLVVRLTQLVDDILFHK